LIARSLPTPGLTGGDDRTLHESGKKSCFSREAGKIAKIQLAKRKIRRDEAVSFLADAPKFSWRD
jgi:hypothetical protein